MSHRVMDESVLPVLKNGGRAVLLVLDNFRFDQWMTVRQIFTDHFNIEKEDFCCSILPTATQYARNSLFSGLLPAEIKKTYPSLWIEESSDESKNLNEESLLKNYLQRKGLAHKSMSFYKANNSAQLARVINDVESVSSDFIIIVVNFIDILSHAKSDSNMVKELASTDAAYRSLTLSWFRHSPFSELLQKLARTADAVFFTTDHGSIRVKRPIKVVSERDTNTALRYKHGRNLAYPGKEVLALTQPAAAGLPSPNLSTTYIFAGEWDFFAYGTNFNQYVRHFTDTYQHGGVSFEEMIVPLVTLKRKL